MVICSVVNRQGGNPEDIKTRLAADFTGWERNNAKFEREFEGVVKGLCAVYPGGQAIKAQNAYFYALFVW